MYKTGQSGRFLGRLLKPLLKNGLSLIKNLKLEPFKPLNLLNHFLIPLLLTAAASATDAAIQRKMLGSVLWRIWFIDKRRLPNN